MKKRFSVFLATALLLTLCACRSAAESPVITTLSPKATAPSTFAIGLKAVPGLSYTECPGVEVQVESLTREDGKASLSILWKNSAPDQAVFGSEFYIERLENGTWVSCATAEELCFTAIAYLLEPHSTRQETYSLTDFYDVSQPGTYRFRTKASLHDGANDNFSLWAEFTVSPIGEETPPEPTEVPFRAHYVRTDGYHEGLRYPGVAVIDSRQTLLDYHRTYLEMYGLDAVYPQGGSPATDFLTLCQSYDEAFFRENYLLFLILQEGSGSIRHQVDQVLLQADGRPAVYLHREVPEVGTSDMAQWHVILELERTGNLPTSETVQVYVDSQLAYAGGVVVTPRPLPFYEDPPAGLLSTPAGEIKLSVAGGTWYAGDGVAIFDRNGRPLPRNLLENCGLALQLDPQTSEPVFVYLPEKDAYEPINSRGYFGKLSWDRMPDTVTVVCWPDTVWTDGNTPEESVVTHENAAFYAKPGRYIYEITATWQDDGSSCYGTVQYYVYLCDQ